MAKTGAFYFLFEKRSQKTFRAEGFRKCLESKSVLCFLLSVVYIVFLHLQYVIEEIKSCSGVLLLTQFFFVRFFNEALPGGCPRSLVGILKYLVSAFCQGYTTLSEI